MSKLVDLTGRKFARLTVVSRAENTVQGKPKWNCKCDCGNVVVVSGYCLKSKHTQSCGCLKQEKVISRNKTHGLTTNPLYGVWCNMKQRINNDTNAYYSLYGGRGIDICEEWESDFQAFYTWSIQNGYEEGLTIDRIDNDNGYYPANCRWVNQKQQQNNKSNNILVEYQGKIKTLSEWAEVTNIKWTTLRTRIVNLKWNIEKALTTPPGNTGRKKSNL